MNCQQVDAIRGKPTDRLTVIIGDKQEIVVTETGDSGADEHGGVHRVERTPIEPALARFLSVPSSDQVSMTRAPWRQPIPGLVPPPLLLRHRLKAGHQGRHDCPGQPLAVRLFRGGGLVLLDRLPVDFPHLVDRVLPVPAGYPVPRRPGQPRRPGSSPSRAVWRTASSRSRGV